MSVPNMQFVFARWLLVLVAASIAIAPLPSTATIRVSFVNDEESMSPTLGIMSNSGFSDDSIACFRHIVKSYYAAGFDLDRSRFPKPKNGFYSFPTMDVAALALPHPVCEAQHAWDLNCFDSVIIMAGDKLQIGLRPDENFGPFLISTSLANGTESIVFAATARDAWSLNSTQWYRDATDAIFPNGMQDARICLNAELFRWHLLPASTTEPTLEKEIWNALKVSAGGQNQPGMGR